MLTRLMSFVENQVSFQFNNLNGFNVMNTEISHQTIKVLKKVFLISREELIIEAVQK